MRNITIFRLHLFVVTPQPVADQQTGDDTPVSYSFSSNVTFHSPGIFAPCQVYPTLRACRYRRVSIFQIVSDILLSEIASPLTQEATSNTVSDGPLVNLEKLLTQL